MGQNISEEQQLETSASVRHQMEKRFKVCPHPLFPHDPSFSLLHEKLSSSKFVLRVIATNDQSQKMKLEELILKKLARKSSFVQILSNYFFEEESSYCSQRNLCYLLFEICDRVSLREHSLKLQIKKQSFQQKQLISGLHQLLLGLLELKHLEHPHGNLNSEIILYKEGCFTLSDPWISPATAQYPEKYPSPEKVMKIHNRIDDYDAYASDAFSAAMVILELAVGHVPSIYRKNHSIDYQLLEKTIQKCPFISLQNQLNVLLLGSIQDRQKYLEHLRENTEGRKIQTNFKQSEIEHFDKKIDSANANKAIGQQKIMISGKMKANGFIESKSEVRGGIVKRSDAMNQFPLPSGVQTFKPIVSFNYQEVSMIKPVGFAFESIPLTSPHALHLPKFAPNFPLSQPSKIPSYSTWGQSNQIHSHPIKVHEPLLIIGKESPENTKWEEDNIQSFAFKEKIHQKLENLEYNLSEAIGKSITSLESKENSRIENKKDLVHSQVKSDNESVIISEVIKVPDEDSSCHISSYRQSANLPIDHIESDLIPFSNLPIQNAEYPNKDFYESAKLEENLHVITSFVDLNSESMGSGESQERRVPEVYQTPAKSADPQFSVINNLTIPEECSEDEDSLNEGQGRSRSSQYREEVYENGGKYIGFVKKGKRNGEGTFYYKDGGYYQGQWKENMMNGFGKLYYDSGDLAYDGQWYKDEFHGRGKVFNDSADTLEGPFNFRNIENVEMYWKSYEGDLSHDMKSGHGKIILTNGETYTGQFRNDKVHGKGVFNCLDGQLVRGQWSEGVLVKEQ